MLGALRDELPDVPFMVRPWSASDCPTSVQLLLETRVLATAAVACMHPQCKEPPMPLLLHQALTATATPRVQDDLIKNLKLKPTARRYVMKNFDTQLTNQCSRFCMIPAW